MFQKSQKWLFKKFKNFSEFQTFQKKKSLEISQELSQSNKMGKIDPEKHIEQDEKFEMGSKAFQRLR